MNAINTFFENFKYTGDMDGFFSKDTGSLDYAVSLTGGTNAIQVDGIHGLLLLVILGIGIKTIIKNVFGNFSADTKTKQTADTEANLSETWNVAIKSSLFLLLLMLIRYLEFTKVVWENWGFLFELMLCPGLLFLWLAIHRLPDN